MRLPDELQFIANAKKTQLRTDARLDGKHCVLTGATSGVGLAVAWRLAQGGADLTLVIRDQAKGQAVRDELTAAYPVQVEIVLADFTDLAQVRAAAEEILASGKKIDLLINNAGLHNTRRRLTGAGHEMVFCVNHLASFMITSLLLPGVIESAPARIIQINSQGHRFGWLNLNDLDWKKRFYIGLQGYGASKVAQLLTVWEFNDRLAGTGVTINAVHPGEAATNIGMNNGWLHRAYQKYILFPLLQDPAMSGESIYYMAAAPEMEGVTGRFFNQTIEEKPAAYTGAIDRELGKRVWQISEALTGLKE
jgi:NAD(P)-dependent dehydrogenase (short-subunit alcohol dehydrogenase family)